VGELPVAWMSRSGRVWESRRAFSIASVQFSLRIARGLIDVLTDHRPIASDLTEMRVAKATFYQNREWNLL
jgi:hypothetical protein